MIILDTNVLSELMKPSPSVQVTGWMARIDAAQIFLTSITQAEILHGIELLAKGKRRRELESAAEALFSEDFAGRILPFDGDAARAFAAIAAARRTSGRPMAQLDAQIAAIARSRGAAIATRNTDDFDRCGIVVLDPWDGTSRLY